MDNGTLRLLYLQRDGWSVSFMVLNKVFFKGLRILWLSILGNWKITHQLQWLYGLRHVCLDTDYEFYSNLEEGYV